MKIFYFLFFALCSTAVYGQGLLDLQVIGTYSSGIFDDGAIEVVTYNNADQRAYAINGSTGAIDVFDLSDPTNITLSSSISVTAYGSNANSVDFQSGILVAAVEADDFDANGNAVFFDAAGNFLAQVEVGVLPDMVTFTPDGNYVLTANEGEPDDDYTADPIGTVSIIDLSGGVTSLTQDAVTTLDFTGFNQGFDPAIRVFGPNGNILNEDFQDNMLELNTFNAVSVNSDRDWFYDSFEDDFFAEANGFGGDAPSDDWLISDALDLSMLSSASFSFESSRNFDGGDFRVLVSTNYDGGVDPRTADWTDLTDQATLSPGDFEDTPSGEIDLTAFISSTTYVAFQYTSTGGAAGQGALWQIDDIKVSAPALLLSHNIEPEYVAVAPNSQTAFVACQENNALAVIDIVNGEIVALKSLGFKDHSAAANGFDASNRDEAVNIQAWPTLGMYMPDAIKAVEIGGATYVVSANEGDARDYDAYSEEERVGDLNLDAEAYPNAAMIQVDEMLGRLNSTTATGDTDGDGDIDQIYSYGSRSFSIWDANGDLVWDSGDQFEQLLATDFADNFNSNNDDNDSFDSRSDDKGPEPEAVEIGEIAGRTLAFIGLERMGGVMTYDITDPTDPQFISYYLNRNFGVDAESVDAGDLGPEDLRFVPADQSPTQSPLLLTANEVSGTLSVYELSGAIVDVAEAEGVEPLRVYPNPVRRVVNFNRSVAGTLYDLQGRPLATINNTNAMDVQILPSGLYIFQAEDGAQVQILKVQ